jgi:hypothetical protein
MRLAKYVKFREEKFGGVLFETRSEKVYTLNPTAVAIVKEVQAGADAPEIARRLKSRFEDPADALDRDVSSVIAGMREMGLVED